MSSRPALCVAKASEDYIVSFYLIKNERKGILILASIITVKNGHFKIFKLSLPAHHSKTFLSS